MLLLSVVQTIWAQTKGEEAANRVALHDVGAASVSMAWQATAEVLLLHQIGGFKVAEAKESLALPETCEPVAMIGHGLGQNP